MRKCTPQIIVIRTIIPTTMAQGFICGKNTPIPEPSSSKAPSNITEDKATPMTKQ
jgi:hypothetical protein